MEKQKQPSSTTRLIVVDDHPIFRSGLVDLLSRYPGFSVLGEGGDGSEALALVQQLEPDVALIDLHMPGGGIDTIRLIHQVKPQTRIVVLTVSEQQQDLFAAMDCGARGYVLKTCDFDQLVGAIKLVAGGGVYISPTLAVHMMERLKKPLTNDIFAYINLSNREMEVLRLVAGGAGNKQIAATLAISERTVKVHLREILGKLHVNNRAQAVGVASARGLLGPNAAARTAAVAIKFRAASDNRRWLVLAAVAGIYGLMNLGLPRLSLDGQLKSYVIQPLLWGLIILLVFQLPSYQPAGKLRTRSTIFQMALLVGAFQVALYIVGGFFSGFGNSPSSFTPLGILSNLALFGAMLVAMELARAWLINHFGRHIFVSLTAVAVLFALIAIPLTQLTSLGPNVSSVGYINSTLLPTLAESLLATLLALLAGPKASIAYRGILQAFWLFCPILPDLSWVFKGLIGTVVPIIGVVSVWQLFLAQSHAVTGSRKASEGSLGGWVITAVVSVLLIWFSAGVFPVKPEVIASGSMTPAIQVGDVVIAVKKQTDLIKTGDIIVFRTAEKETIIHRVYAIEQDDNGQTIFITKGDANNAPDADPVLPANVLGQSVLTIPKIGWLAVWVKEVLAH